MKILYLILLFTSFSFSLEGRVVKENDQGIAQATIWFTPVDGDSFTRYQTNESGNFQIELETSSVSLPVSQGRFLSEKGTFSKLKGQQSFRIPLEVQRGSKKIYITNINGSVIYKTDLLKEQQQEFYWVWDENERIEVPDGVYFYHIKYTNVSSNHFASKTTALNNDLYNVKVYGKGIVPFIRDSLSLNELKEIRVRSTDLWDSNRVVLRSLFQHARRQFETGSGRVAFLGGSITNQNGWRDTVQNYLSRTFPTTTFDFIEAGVPSLGSKYHAFRFERDVLKNGKVDMLFMESAVNDESIPNQMTDTLRFRATEGIAAQALKSNPKMEVIQLHFLKDTFYSYVNNQQPIPPVVVFDSVGKYYGASMQNLARYVAERYTWQQFGSNVHPKDFGNRLYGNNIIKMFETAWGEDSIEYYSTHPVPSPMNSYSFTGGSLLSIDSVQSLGGWTKINNWSPTQGSSREDWKNRPVLKGVPGNELTISFSGPLIGIVANDAYVGKVRYSIDNGPYQVVNTHDTLHTGVNIGRPRIFASELSPGAHTLRLGVDNTTTSGKKEVYLFDFIVNLQE